VNLQLLRINPSRSLNVVARGINISGLLSNVSRIWIRS
jgi:hypothetical protein